ncbi:MAG: hypothetical protein MUP44_08245, partial [Anaerolineales bacterium]|nr:hypothetical protein [Anaerolineales bacterium]
SMRSFIFAWRKPTESELYRNPREYLAQILFCILLLESGLINTMNGFSTEVPNDRISWIAASVESVPSQNVSACQVVTTVTVVRDDLN